MSKSTKTEPTATTTVTPSPTVKRYDEAFKKAAVESWIKTGKPGTQIAAELGVSYSINIIAHSQGNDVASEALIQGAPFDNYILTQGAIPAQCYDGGAPQPKHGKRNEGHKTNNYRHDFGCQSSVALHFNRSPSYAGPT